MTWTREEKLDALMRMPWTVECAPSEFGSYLTARIKEIPDAIATGENERALAQDMYAAIRASLAARLEFDDAIQLPAEQVAPWDLGDAPRAQSQGRKIVTTLRRGPGWDDVFVGSSGEAKVFALA